MTLNKKKQSLLTSTIVALLIAIVALVLFILPAEYNIDPTGVGEKLGLTVFNGQGKETVAPKIDVADSQPGSVTITVPAGRGIEYKLAMKKHASAGYEWTTDGTAVYVDLHGEPKGDTTGYFKSYAIATSDEMKGSFIAPFEGSHGWYWKNTSDQDVKIELIFHGEYVIEGIK
ncbi:MAG: hypothetical protein HRU25_08245 [Psychrobium sp.]|nr:hypothetical protein [Psychrobium sp.]